MEIKGGRRFKQSLLVAMLLVLTLPVALSSEINSTNYDGLVGYDELDQNYITSRTWDHTFDFGSAVLETTADVGADLTWNILKASHEYDQITLGSIDKDLDINIQIYNESKAWSNLKEVSTSIVNSAYRSFDMEYEDISGDLLIVFENSTSSDSDLRYLFWNGTAYTTEQFLTTTLVGSTVHWVELVPRIGTDEIMLVVMTAANDMYAIPWNGSAFDSNKEISLTTGTSSDTFQNYAFAWEVNSGQGFVAYAEGTNLVYRTYSPTEPHWSTEATISLGSSNLEAVRMCSDSDSNYIGMIYVDSGNDLDVRMWDGTEVMSSPPSTDTSVESTGPNTANLDCVWSKNGSTATFGFVDNNALSMDYLTFSKASSSWSTSALTSTSNTGNFASDDIESLRFQQHPIYDAFTVIVQDRLEDVSAIYYNGSDFVSIASSPIEGTTEVSNGAQESAYFVWYAYDTVPNVTNPLPINNTNFVKSSTIAINVSVTDNTNVSYVQANVTLPNSSIQSVQLTDGDGDDTYTGTFDSTSQAGTYTVMIEGNDTSSHKNVNGDISFILTIGDVSPPNVSLILPTQENFNLSDSLSISANATDPSNISGVLANVTLPDGNTQQITLQASGNNFNNSFTNTSLVGVYTINFYANDTENNLNDSVSTTFSVGDPTAPNITVIAPTGQNVDLNDSVLINITVADTSNISSAWANITLPNGSLEIVRLTGGSNYNVSYSNTAVTGRYNISFVVNDTDGNLNNTVEAYFTAGDLIKPLITLSTPTNNQSTTNSSVDFVFTPTDEASSTLSCDLVLDSTTNQSSSSISNGTETTLSITGLVEGTHYWHMNCSDATGNSNVSINRSVVIDYSAPTFVSLTTSPGTEVGLDPNVNVTVKVNITDTLSTSIVTLQYRLANETFFTNTSMSYNSATSLFEVNITPTNNGTYILRTFANDTLGNSDFSNTVNISIQEDKTWEVSPSTLSPVLAELNENVSIGNFTVNNTGDVDINFTISSDSNRTIFNSSTTFSISPGELYHVTVNGTGVSYGTNSVTTTITADSDADPTSDTVVGNIVVADGQPVLSATFLTPSDNKLTVEPGDTNVALSAKLTNLGEGNASNLTFYYELPDGWELTYGDSNESIDTLITGDSEEKVIEFSIPSNTTEGSYIIPVNATGVNATGVDLRTIGFIFGETVNVTVQNSSNLGSTSTTSTESSSSSSESSSAAGSSGGGGGSGSVSLGSFVGTVLSDQELVESSATFHLVRGKADSFPIRITNLFPKTTIQNVQVIVDGYFAQFLEVTPSMIESVPYNESVLFDVTVTSQDFMEPGRYDITALITGSIVGTRIDREFIETREITVIIHTNGEEDAKAAIEQAGKDIESMKNKGYPTTKLDLLLKDAKSYLEKKEYDLATELALEVSQLRKDAFETMNIIDGVSTKVSAGNIITGAFAGFQRSFKNTEDLIALARAAFDREDFKTALQRAKDAQLSLAAQSAEFRLLFFVLDFWWLILLFGFLFSIGGWFTYQSYSISKISENLKDLDLEEESIREEMRKIQSKYFSKGEVGSETYKQTMNQFTKRLGKIKEIRSRLRHKRVNRLNAELLEKDLAQERKSIQKRMKSLQHKYYIRGKVNPGQYESDFQAYHSRLSQIEKEILGLKMKRTKKK